MSNRNPPIIQELNRQLLKLQRYLYNFWLRNIKKLAFKQGLPVEFFRQKYENQVNIAIHKFIEQVYLKTIESLQKKLLLKQKRQQQQRQQQLQRKDLLPPPPPPPTTLQQQQTPASNLFTSLVDVTNINQIATTSTNQYFNSVGRLLDRQSFTSKITMLATIHQMMLFADMAAFQRVANYAAYNTFNTAIQSKLLQINDDTTKLRYVTAKDEKVCPICIPFDGKIYQSSIDLDIPDLPQHPNCRCFLEVII